MYSIISRVLQGPVGHKIYTEFEMSGLCESEKHGMEGHDCVSQPLAAQSLAAQLFNGDPNEDKPLMNKSPSPMSKAITIMFLCLSMFSVGAGYSLLAPFFPTKAKSKGISELWIGLIVAQYQIAVIFGSSKNWAIFGFVCCGYRKFLNEATTEMCYGLGMIVGPALGGILYQIGDDYLNIGFCVPFWSFGTFLAFISLLSQILVPKRSMEQNCVKTIGIFNLLKNFGFTLCLANTINAALLIGFNEATLDLHLAQIETLLPSTKGLIFLLSGFTYTIVSQVCGYLGDKIKNCYPMCLFGCGASIVCFTFIGPLPFIPIEPIAGFPENMSTYAVMAGVLELEVICWENLDIDGLLFLYL
ncbi:unnamed protein product [Medioppia subpectinata]|uniref:Uncharacterized protein n=1 Tax=Medioppia subpectinata TaxID=1979941 RepID=A0A7R9KHF7_9ACAR|nr:unnamed protein product [Medioppia subpectinata]CAG2103398.1 unnamed protein product [Medioppia subpectinata]